ncbi:MAG: hypothetical protein FWH29_04770 [Methanobrevibacter sp.]|nr:hypothetical protein [Methanobrevibacter sp.]
MIEKIDENLYREYLDKWFEGIEYEIHFWQFYIENKGKCYDSNFDDVIKNTLPFDYEEIITKKETKFLDVGSGPFSCGLKTDLTKFEAYAVDPLAYIYKSLKKKYNISSGITPEFAMVERLNAKFKSNEFDIVHMQNALDHSFNPLLGIYSMIDVCKIGGKIILHHKENEAETENYRGFHQWNVSIKNSEFIIWRPGTELNVTKILEDYVDVISIGKKKPYDTIKIILVKNKDIMRSQITQQSYILEEKVFEKISEYMVNNVYKSGKRPFGLLRRLVYKVCCRGFLGSLIYNFAMKIFYKYKN